MIEFRYSPCVWQSVHGNEEMPCTSPEFLRWRALMVQNGLLKPPRSWDGAPTLPWNSDNSV